MMGIKTRKVEIETAWKQPSASSGSPAHILYYPSTYSRILSSPENRPRFSLAASAVRTWCSSEIPRDYGFGISGRTRRFEADLPELMKAVPKMSSHPETLTAFDRNIRRCNQRWHSPVVLVPFHERIRLTPYVHNPAFTHTRELYPMAASFGVAATSEPTFPEDIERTINEVLLNDARDMCGTMSLVASRFHTWTRPIMFHTVIIRRRGDWIQRISDCLLLNASFIRVLVLDLTSTQLPRVRAQIPDEELSPIRLLLEASGRVGHLAVTWNIWAHLQRECGALRLESLYLVWDGATAECVSLAYVTYASDRIPPVARRGTPAYVGGSSLKGVMLVIVGRTEKYDSEDRPLEKHRNSHPNFTIRYTKFWAQVLAEWVGKIEQRESLLEIPDEESTVKEAMEEEESRLASAVHLGGAD
ncbi:hypothetical protein C8R44DRAFT_744117 [Mycena epipterygia]|nr:hypothetical protein C8R44DRAFT_744117 [Mycena epipterygia]